MFKTLVFAISVLLGQAGQDDFLVHVELLKESLEKKEDRRQLKKLGKEYERTQKELEIFRQNQASEFARIAESPEKNTRELRNLLNKQKHDQLIFISALIDLRFQIQSIPEPAEWNNYLNVAFKQPEIPSEHTVFENLTNLENLTELTDTLNVVFSGSKYATQVQAALQNLIQNLTEITLNEADRQVASAQILVSQNATQTQLQKVVEDRFLYQNALTDAFLGFRKDILEITERADWNSVSPTLSKLVYE